MRKPRRSDWSSTPCTASHGILAVAPRLSSTRIFIQSTPASALASTAARAAASVVAAITGPATITRARTGPSRASPRSPNASAGSSPREFTVVTP